MLSHPAFWNSSLSDSLCSYFLNPPHSPLTNSLIYIFLLILPTLIAQIPTHHHSLQVTGPANSPVALSFHKAKYVTPVPHISSVAQLCLAFCDPMDCSTAGLPVHHQLPESNQTHVHWVGDAIQPSYPLSSPSSPAFNLSQHQGLFKWGSSSHQVAKVLEFQLQHQSFQWTPRTDLL